MIAGVIILIFIAKKWFIPIHLEDPVSSNVKKYRFKEGVKRALEFVHGRERGNGGFTLYEGIPDTKNTYYGVLTLKLLGIEPENMDKTIEWVEYLQRGRMFGLKGLFYRVNILKLLNREPELNEKYFERLRSK